MNEEAMKKIEKYEEKLKKEKTKEDKEIKERDRIISFVNDKFKEKYFDWMCFIALVSAGVFIWFVFFTNVFEDVLSRFFSAALVLIILISALRNYLINKIKRKEGLI